jgi:hypothetical protein
MKPFHYNQDPLYAAAALILQGKPLTEENDSNSPKKLEEDNGVLISALKEKGYTRLGMEQLAPAIRKARVNTPLGAVVNAYAKEDEGKFVLFYDDATVSVIMNGKVNFGLSLNRALDLIESKEIDEQSDGDFKSLIGKTVYHGSPGYPVKEVIASIDPHQTKKGSFSVEFESGIFDTLSGDELDELMNGVDVRYKSPHGGLTVIKLQEDEDFYSQKMIKNQLQTIVRNSNECLQMIEDDREFPEWAQSEIAVAEDGIVSVTEFMQSHSDGAKLDEAKSSYGMGTATIVDPDNKSGLDGKQVNIFHKFDDGRINVQYDKVLRPGKVDVRNLTLKKGQYKLDEAVATADIKKLINGIDDLSKEDFKQFLLVFADHMDETSKYARTNTGASRESIKAVSNYLASAAEAFKI